MQLRAAISFTLLAASSVAGSGSAQDLSRRIPLDSVRPNRLPFDELVVLDGAVKEGTVRVDVFVVPLKARRGAASASHTPTAASEISRKIFAQSDVPTPPKQCLDNIDGGRFELPDAGAIDVLHWRSKDPVTSNAQRFAVVAGPFQPGSHFFFCVATYGKAAADALDKGKSAMPAVAPSLEDARTALTTAAAVLTEPERDSFKQRIDSVSKPDSLRALEAELRGQLAIGTTTADLPTRSSRSISPDIGFAFIAGHGMNRLVPTAGLNFYFRPVNRDVPLNAGLGRDSFGRRFHAYLGVTLASLQEGDRFDLFGGRNLLLGAGWRITDFLRAGAGLVVFQSTNSDQPLRETKRPAAAPYFSIGLDFQLKDLLGPLGGVFTK
ncbi:MAG: hypothetical protein NW201_14265 [Gemmatimonadales bacterium]|nr:hypothetical protein [Gemmatimonadales bacterium]